MKGTMKLMLAIEENLHEKYGNLASTLSIEQGLNGMIYSPKNCVAVGSFVEDSFSERVKGKMYLDELSTSMR